jgi:hypothetical protein
VIESRTLKGSVSFCSLGILPVSVSVGDRGCNQVVVNNVPLRWQKSVNLQIIYDVGPCLAESIPAPACSMLIRVVDQAGQPVSGPTLAADEPHKVIMAGDAGGRVMVQVPLDKQLRALVYAPGYSGSDVLVACNGDNLYYERKVSLRQSR